MHSLAFCSEEAPCQQLSTGPSGLRKQEQEGLLRQDCKNFLKKDKDGRRTDGKLRSAAKRGKALCTILGYLSSLM
jgi:hypothetical protein